MRVASSPALVKWAPITDPNAPAPRMKIFIVAPPYPWIYK
jgi:hypothetical protein